MKRFVSLLIIVCMLCSGAFADEILFRDIPWFCTPSEFEDYLKGEGLEVKKDIWPEGGFKSGSWANTPGEVEWRCEDVPQYSARYKHPEKGKYIAQVAGYDVSIIYSYFLPRCDEVANQIGKSDNSQLVKASYQIYSTKRSDGIRLTWDEIYADLCEKLSSLHGSPLWCGEKDLLDISREKITTWWSDTTRTAVTVTYTNIWDSTQWIKIDYAYIAVREYVEKIDRIMKHIEGKNNEAHASNVEGL